MAEGQVPSPYGTEELQRAADHFAAFVLVSPSFSTCEDWAALPEDEQGDCAWSSLERFAQRAWRRPITEAETERLRAFFENNGQGGDLTEAVVLTAAGILQTPAFVFRMESGDQAGAVGEAIPLDDWEMASRLSYFLWNSMPDPQLFGAAARGELSTRAEVEAQARRMLDDPRARDAVVAFHHQWLGTRAVRHISPARRVYGPVYGIAPAPLLDTTGDGDWPAILGPVRHSMEAETHLFMERTIFDGGGTLEALLTDNHGYMSEHTEVLYGPDAQATPGARVDWDYGVVVFSMGAQSSLELYPAEFPPTERAGVLTLPAVLALGAYAVHPAPIIRGKLVLERLACQALGSPPPGAEAAVPPDTESAAATNRARTAQATSAEVCASCHDTLNPPGFAFEHYDAMGRWRAEDNGETVDASGTLDLWSGESFAFADGVELARQLSTSTQVQDCYALRWARYATGVQLAPDQPTVAQLQEAFRADDDIKALLVAIAGSDLVRYLRAGGAP